MAGLPHMVEITKIIWFGLPRGVFIRFNDQHGKNVHTTVIRLDTNDERSRHENLTLVYGNITFPQKLNTKEDFTGIFNTWELDGINNDERIMIREYLTERFKK